MQTAPRVPHFLHPVGSKRSGPRRCPGATYVGSRWPRYHAHTSLPPSRWQSGAQDPRLITRGQMHLPIPARPGSTPQEASTQPAPVSRIIYNATIRRGRLLTEPPADFRPPAPRPVEHEEPPCGEERRARSWCCGGGSPCPARGRLSWRCDVPSLAPWFVLGACAGLFTAWAERTIIGAEGAAELRARAGVIP